MNNIGESFSIRELNYRMITVSSNLATNLLIERVTPKRQRGLCKNWEPTMLLSTRRRR